MNKLVEKLCHMYLSCQTPNSSRKFIPNERCLACCMLEGWLNFSDEQCSQRKCVQRHKQYNIIDIESATEHTSLFLTYSCQGWVCDTRKQSDTFPRCQRIYYKNSDTLFSEVYPCVQKLNWAKCQQQTTKGALIVTGCNNLKYQS